MWSKSLKKMLGSQNMSNVPDHIDFFNKVLNINFSYGSTSKEIVSCQDCISDENDVKEVNGYYVCSLCGVIIKERISDTAEWSNYVDSGGSSTNNSRCGISIKSTDINPYSTGMTSYIPKGVKNVCYEDGKLVKYDISRLHMKNNFNHLHKSFNDVENKLDNITNDKYPKRIVDTAKMLWAEIMEKKKVTRAGVRRGLIACCLYYACIHFNTTRSPLEICRDFGMNDTKDFNKGDKEFKETFETIPRWSHLLTKTSNPEYYIGRFCSDLEMNHVIKEGQSFVIANRCREIYDKIQDHLFELFPKNAACGIIFWELKKNKISITKTEFARILDLCLPSLTKANTVINSIIGKP